MKRFRFRRTLPSESLCIAGFRARFRKSKQSSSASRAGRFRPTFEPLEQRMLLSINMTKWSTQDIVYTTTNTSSNWYTDSHYLQVTFTPPVGSGLSNIVTKGFWDGNNVFKVRFTPTVEGTWSYSTTGSTIGGLSNTTDDSGQIIVSAAASGEHGFVRIDPTYPNSFKYDDGTRYFMWGQTYYDWVTTATLNNNYQTSVDNDISVGFTKIRFQVYSNDVPGEANPYISQSAHPEPYTGALNSPNRDSLDLPYWQALDAVVQYMDAHGIGADLIVTSGYNSNRQFGTDAQNDRFVSYVVALRGLRQRHLVHGQRVGRSYQR